MAQQGQTAGQAFGDLGDLFDKAMSLFNGGKAGSAGTEAAAPEGEESSTSTTKMQPMPQLPGVSSLPDFIHGYLHGAGAFDSSAGSGVLPDVTGAGETAKVGKSGAASQQQQGSGKQQTIGGAVSDIMGAVAAIGALFA